MSLLEYILTHNLLITYMHLTALITNVEIPALRVGADGSRSENVHKP